MNGQRDFFGGIPRDYRQPYHVKGSDTSRAAADSIRPHLGRLQSRVYRLFVEAGSEGLTDNEIEHRLGLRHQSASARRRELEILGLVARSDQRRRTDSGRWAGVYRRSHIRPQRPIEFKE